MHDSHNISDHINVIFYYHTLTHWGQGMHICVGKLTIIGSDNVLSLGLAQTIIQNNARILLIVPLGTNFREILIRIQTFSFKKMSSVKWRPFCLGLCDCDAHCSVVCWLLVNMHMEIIDLLIYINQFECSCCQYHDIRKGSTNILYFYLDINKDISWNIRTKFSS